MYIWSVCVYILNDKMLSIIYIVLKNSKYSTNIIIFIWVRFEQVWQCSYPIHYTYSLYI
jgi:hypothetical protein